MIETALDKIISKITVRLKNVNNDYIGSGVLYYQENFKEKVYVLTASHCLFKDGDKFLDQSDEIFIDISKSNSIEYETISVQVNSDLLFTDTTKDVAVLILDKKEVENINEIKDEFNDAEWEEVITRAKLTQDWLNMLNKVKIENK